MDNVIPELEEILKTSNREETDWHKKWLNRTAVLVSKLIKRRIEDLKRGDSINFYFPALRDMGRSLREWRDCYQEIVVLVEAKHYKVEVLTPGDPPTPVLIISIPEKKEDE